MSIKRFTGGRFGWLNVMASNVVQGGEGPVLLERAMLTFPVPVGSHASAAWNLTMQFW